MAHIVRICKAAHGKRYKKPHALVLGRQPHETEKHYKINIHLRGSPVHFLLGSMANSQGQQSANSAAPDAQSNPPLQAAQADAIPRVTNKEFGYHALATTMSSDKGFSQFKRFAKLNTHCLLMQQAELLYLEGRLHTIASVDEAQGLAHNRNVEALLDSAEKGQFDEQWKLVLQVREKLKEYNDALLQQAAIRHLLAPRKYDCNMLRQWLGRSTGGDNFLISYELLPFLEEQEPDLVSVSERNFDSFTAWIAERAIPWASNAGLLKRPALAGHEEVGLVSWPDKLFYRAAHVLAIVASALIPSLAILILYFVPNMLGRIFVAMVLSFLFSACLALGTTARPAEVFAATVAFAAVQVVFIGSSSIALA